MVALVLSGESALQHGGDLTPQVGPQMLSAAVRRCALQGLPPPAPPIVQQVHSGPETGHALVYPGTRASIVQQVPSGYLKVLQ